jgi:hypothetical protein
VFLHLLVIDHDTMPAPVRLVANTEDVVSDGETYTAFPFRCVLPPAVQGELPQLDLVVDNVTRELVDEIRSIATPASLTISVVLAATPDTVEVGPYLLEVVGAAYDRHEVRLSLAAEPLLTEPYPQGLFTPGQFPLLFNAVET